MRILVLDLESNQVMTEARNIIGVIGKSKLNMEDVEAKLSFDLVIDAKELVKMMLTKEDKIAAIENPRRAIRL